MQVLAGLNAARMSWDRHRGVLKALKAVLDRAAFHMKLNKNNIFSLSP